LGSSCGGAETFCESTLTMDLLYQELFFHFLFAACKFLAKNHLFLIRKADP
jgi:hypothetical protein